MKKVLVIQNDNSLRHLFCWGLQKQGYKVQGTNTTDWIEIAFVDVPEVVILDVSPPDQAEILPILQTSKFHYTKVIVVSSSISHDLRSFDLPSLEVMLKPISPHELGLSIEALFA